MRLYSYCVQYDGGAAPNPFWGICTLVICKPAIRHAAEIDNWSVGLGSANSPIGDISTSVVYAMKVTRKLTMKEYDQFYKILLPKKIPDQESQVGKLSFASKAVPFRQIDYKGRIKRKDGRQEGNYSSYWQCRKIFSSWSIPAGMAWPYTDLPQHIIHALHHHEKLHFGNCRSYNDGSRRMYFEISTADLTPFIRQPSLGIV